MAASPSIVKVRVSWQSKLRQRNGLYLGDELNVLLAFQNAPELTGLLRFNDFALNIELTRAPPWRKGCGTWTEDDDRQMLIWLMSNEIPARNVSVVATAALVCAQGARFHPVRNYLDGLIWDGTERLKTWTARYLGATGNEAYLSAVGTRFPISAIARIYQPGCQADHVLVLEGKQGIGKTSAARALAILPSWFAGNLPEFHSKDAPLQLIGRWIIEIAELKAMKNAQIEAAKAFITETNDTFRPPYGRRTTQFPRQCVFIATTNESEYLRDRSGNRRYWPIHCSQIDSDGLMAVRDQLWAEAVHEYRNGTQWHLSAYEMGLATHEQGERLFVSELESDVAEYLQTVVNSGRREVFVKDVLVHALNQDPDHPSYTDFARKHGSAVSEALERAGWKKDARRGAERRTLYRLPDKGDKV